MRIFAETFHNKRCFLWAKSAKKTMVKKTFLTLSIIVLLASCGTRDNNNEISTCIDDVVINGIRWATRNVDASGTFADNPEYPGMFFEWNRLRGWRATGELADARWTRNPCPKGWRMPTRSELRSFYNAIQPVVQFTTEEGRIIETTLNPFLLSSQGAIHSRNGGIVYWTSSQNSWTSGIRQPGRMRGNATIILDTGTHSIICDDTGVTRTWSEPNEPIGIAIRCVTI